MSAKHFFVTLSACVINYYTYAKVLRGVWNADPSSPEMLRERRAHMQWLAETITTRLVQDMLAQRVVQA